MKSLTLLVAFALTLAAFTPTAHGQAELIPGSPFGVGKMTIPLDPGFRGDPSGLLIRAADGRLLYPVISKGAINRLFGNAQRPSVTVWFLFTGVEALDITVESPQPRRFIVRATPKPPRVYDRLMRQWWREYHANVRRLVKEGDHPATVYTYLTSMLSRRLQMRPPILSREKDERSEVQQTMELLAGVEGLRNAQLRLSSLGQVDRGGIANLPLPAAANWRDLPPLARDLSVPVEAIAEHVPPECFYVRFGSFENYLWLNRLTREYGGDISRMVQMRGTDAGVDQRVQYQLGLKQSALAEVMGPAVIADVAMIGRDAFVQEGASIGVLFQAKNSALLAIDLNKQRAEALAKEKPNGATLKTIKIGQKDVSFLSTPDNRVRSFYVVDGSFHLVTTSREIARRFIEVAEGAPSLAKMAEFRHARVVHPLSREHTIFVYFSTAFFEGLVSPLYQIELQHRLQSITDAELLQLARWGAANERRPFDTIEQLVRGGHLPAGFGQRVDGSRTIWRDGELIDSRRGMRGTFLPVADVQIAGVTAAEDAAYRRRAAYYQQNWRQMDPVVVGVKRFALNDTGLERVTIEAFITPMDGKKYDWILSSLGAPTTTRIAKTPGDIIWWQASLKGGLLSPATPPHLMFGAIKDQVPVGNTKPEGLLQLYQVAKSTPGYLGAWPQPGFLDRLPLGLAPRPDPAGYAKLPLGLWRRQFDGFAVLAFDPRLLAEISPQLRPLEGTEPAQIRVEVGDLSRAKLAGWINSLNYERARRTSAGNLRLLQTLSQQLGVHRADAKKAAEQLLDARLFCCLGGKYELANTPDGTRRWRSTKLSDNPNALPPADYQAPLLQWFRGLKSVVLRHPDKLEVHAQLDMQRKPVDKPNVKLPLFNFFKGSPKNGVKKNGSGDFQKKKAVGQSGDQKKTPTTKKGPRRFE